MEYYDIGSLIKRVRKQKGITQEELAYPIVDRATLSKIESGKVMPNKSTLKALIQRLGLDPYSVANFFVDKNDAETVKLINELNAYRQYETSDEDEVLEKIDTVLKRLEDNEVYMQNPLNVQRVLIVKAENAMKRKEDPDKIINMLIDAIKISIPEYKESNIADYYLTKSDMSILNVISNVLHNAGRFDDATKLLYRLKTNIEKHCIDDLAKGNSYPPTMNNLANNLHEAKRYEEAISICDAASEVCIETRCMYSLPTLATIKSKCLYELGRIEECEQVTRQAYHAWGLFGQNIVARDNLLKFAEEKLKVKL